MRKTYQKKEAFSSDKAETCQNCGNVYLLVWLKEGHDYNDFGIRHCPFCGLLTDDLTGSVMV